jgi:transaldolase
LPGIDPAFWPQPELLDKERIVMAAPHPTSVKLDASSLKVKLYADGANADEIVRLAQNPLIQGFTTNPTLMRKAGVDDYETFARGILERIDNRPISFEVFGDDFPEMGQQARKLASWGPNVYVKIPVMNTRSEFSGPLIRELSSEGLKLNVTAVMTAEQVREVADALQDVPSVVSVFAGRIADTGRDPMPIMRKAREALAGRPSAELLWASPRELLNVIQADEVGCHIITATGDILAKLPGLGKDLDEFSLETVQMFFNDARAAGYLL